MDLNLPELRRRAPRAAELSLDFRRMVAILAAAQAASPTAAAEATAPRAPVSGVDTMGALVALLSGGRLGDREAQALGGSFHPQAAGFASDVPA